MNKYLKYCPNVFIAVCENSHERGATIEMTTKYGATHEAIVFNFLGKTKEGKFWYSIVRADGFNSQEYAKRRAEKIEARARKKQSQSEAYFNASSEGKEFLSLGEPIKVGHHSEKRHRALIQRNWDRMGKSVQLSKEAEELESKAEYWKNKAEGINLSMPESLEYFEYKLEEARAKHKILKDNPEKRAHSYSLTYANKEVKELEAKVKTAQLLWGEPEEETHSLNKPEYIKHEFIVPTPYLHSLIYGDDSALEQEDIDKIEKFIEKIVKKFGHARFTIDDIEGANNLGFQPFNSIDNLGSDCSKIYLLVKE